jgi:hypothetical protein
VKYGALTKTDAFALECVLSHYAGKPCRLLEIGVHGGDTARGIRDFMAAQGSVLEYWGMDNGSHPDHLTLKPFPEANFINGDSAESFHLVPDKLDVVLVDGCHCFNHVVLDTLHYGERVVPGGLLLFHDITPLAQQTMRDPHGPDIPEFHNSVLEAHRRMGFPFDNWTEQAFAFDGEAKWGGMAVYQKLA